MAYDLLSTQKAPVLDEAGSPIPSASIAGLPLGVGLAATMQDDGAGHLECIGNYPGTVPFILTIDGVTVQHDVTVSAGPFDWTLGTPVAK